MLLVLRWMVRIFLGLALLGASAGALGYHFLARSLPDYGATHRLDGIAQDVEIVRDTNNVPHIFGSTDEDVFFGLGFAHAQDRLWQMVLMRRTAQGRLSEVFGQRTLRSDELMRRLDIAGLARSSVAAQDDATRAALEAYARGVNAWIETVDREARGRGAPEFFLFPSEIALWQPADSLALIKLMGVQTSSHMHREVLRARLSLVLDRERVRDLLPDAPGTGVAALPDYSELFEDLPPDHRPLDWAAAPFSPLRAPPFTGASNAFAAAPSRSAAGGAILANDPHLSFTAPTVWYLARLELTTGGLIGATIPGIPAILSGRSEALGWGLTTAYLDDLDVFIEEIDSDTGARYRSPAGWAEFDTRRTILRVRGEAPRTLTLRWTENGPVLPGHHADLGSITPLGHVTSLSWTLLDGADTTMTAAMRLMRARSIPEAQEAAELHVAPAQWLMLADREGIAMQLVGAMPRRDPEHQTQGRMPAPGWIAANRWQGRLPAADNPAFVAPDGGLLGNTNNKALSRPFPYHVSHDWGDSQRIRRWSRLMGDRAVHTRDSFIEAQLDTVSEAARTLLPLVAGDLWFADEAAPAGTPERLRQRALALLADWNGEMNEHLPEPLIYAAWMRALQDRLIRDELGPLASSFTHVEPLFIERVFRDLGGASAWCNVRQSSREETCPEMARLALDDALVWLSERYGANPESWRWGDAHQATHDHPALGEVRLLRHFVNIRQSTSGGDHTLNRGLTRGGSGPDPFHNVHGAGYRGVYDFADPDSSVFITATGQSGHPLSRHYDDLGERWRRGDYIPMSLDPELARGGAVGITRLVPR
ncbi:MAG: penicillin acylase family protein [Alkalilacustris sp.]